jgi:hypothetical protein
VRRASALVDIESGRGIQWIVGNNDEMPSLSGADVFPVSASLQAYRSWGPGSGSGFDRVLSMIFAGRPIEAHHRFIEDYRSAPRIRCQATSRRTAAKISPPTRQVCHRARDRQGRCAPLKRWPPKAAAILDRRSHGGSKEMRSGRKNGSAGGRTKE